MKRTAIQNAEYFAARRRRRTRWRRMLACMASAVALSTVLLLMRPAVTLESPQCGLDEHTHVGTCYTQVTQVERRVLICGYDDESPPDETPQESEIVDEPVSEEPNIEEPIAEESIDEPVEEPVTDEPTDEPIEEEPVTDEPVEEEPVDEPVEEPTEEEPAETPHVHTDACYATVTEPADTETLTCPLDEDETHTHSFLCYGTWELTCPLTEHVHTDACRAGLSEEEQAQVDALIDEIDALPTDEEIDDTLDALADDPEAMEAWYTALLQQVQDALDAYNALTEVQQAAVPNAERLTELDRLWDAEVLTDGFLFADPTVVDYASTRDFIELNLYDYVSTNVAGTEFVNAYYKKNTSLPGFQWNGGAYMLGNDYNRHVVDYIDFGNSNITDIGYGGVEDNGRTNGKSKYAIIVGSSSAAANSINKLDVSDYGVTNRPIGMSTYGDVLSRTLVNGYPALADGTTSLKYLFTTGDYVKKQNTESIDGLFQKDEKTGAYFYNSRWNHAQFNSETNTFTLYEQIITPNFIVYPFGNFLPFNTITDSTKATQVSSIDGSSGNTVSDYVQKIQNDLTGRSTYNDSPTSQQLNTMLGKYKDDINNTAIKSSKDAIVDYFTAGGGSGDNPSSDTSLIDDTLLAKMYNIDWDEETNFFFGMEMKMNFFQPKGGKTGTDGKQDMVFYFTGDDDVWVYIDGVLFLDLSGIHRHVGGKIDFVNGKVYYYALDTEKGGDVSTTPYKTYTFEELLKAADKPTDGLNEKGTFKDYTTHSFNFYYMERGSGSSVCRMNFNFPLLKKNSISVTKELDADTPLLGNPDFKFQVLKEGGGLFIGAGVSYDIQNADGEKIGTGKTDTNGVFTLKAGQTAVFSGIKENAGKYFVRELLDSSVFGQYGTITVNGNATTTNNNVTVGSESFTGVDSPVQDMSNGSTLFRFVNHVDTSRLGKLSVAKTVAGYNGIDIATDETFTFEITLDGVPLPAGTEYTVDGKTCRVETAGVIVLKHGETAVIENILAGTKFTVQEMDVPKHYSVSYRVDNGDSQAVEFVKGTVGASGTVAVTVINCATSYELPATGGTGTLVYTAVGLLLCAAALGLLCRKRRRRGASP